MSRVYVRILSLISFIVASYWAFYIYREANLPMRYVSNARMSVFTASGEAISGIQQQQVLAWALSDTLRQRAIQRVADQGEGSVPPEIELGGHFNPSRNFFSLWSVSTDIKRTRPILRCLLDEIRETSADVSAPSSNPFHNELTFRIIEPALGEISDPRPVAVPLMVGSGLPILVGTLLLVVSFRLPRRPPPLPRSGTQS